MTGTYIMNVCEENFYETSLVHKTLCFIFLHFDLLNEQCSVTCERRFVESYNH